MTLIIDAHEDLAWNMVNLQRDYTQSAYDIRHSEKDTPIPAFNGNSLLGWPEYQEAHVGIVFGTLFCSPAVTIKVILTSRTMTPSKKPTRVIDKTWMHTSS